jgi:hypothetical protein
VALSIDKYPLEPILPASTKMESSLQKYEIEILTQEKKELYQPGFKSLITQAEIDSNFITYS